MAKISRREFLKAAGATGAALASAASPFAFNIVKGQSSFEGKLVIVSLGQIEQNQFIIDAIQAAYPGVEVEWRGLTSERFTELFAASEVAGDQIDIMHLNGQDLRRYAVGDRMKDLSDIEYKDRFRQVGLDTYTVGGKLWALPVGGISGFPFLTNLKALEKAGITEELQTYDDLLAAAPDLKAAGVAPFVHAGKNIYLWPIWQFWAYAQTSGNNAIEGTYSVLAGDTKFTDPEHVAALEILYKYAQDGMFIDSVNSMDGDAAWLAFSQGQAAFMYEHSWRIGFYREGDYPELDLSLIPPLQSVPDSVRQLPGGTGAALGIYANIAPEREELAWGVIDLMSSDDVVKQLNDRDKDPVSTNTNVEASDDPLALKYAAECSPNQITYLDWFWPPEITRAFQENQQALVAGTMNPDEAAQAIQDVMDDLYADGYEFVS